jgi:hypothetical protein
MNDAALEAALLRGLADAWDTENHSRFRGRLRRPVFRLADTAKLGLWDRLRRELVLQRTLVRERPWGSTI